MKEEKDQESQAKKDEELEPKVENSQYPPYTNKDAYSNDYGPDDLLNEEAKQDEKENDDENVEENEENDNNEDERKDAITQEQPNLAASENSIKPGDEDNDSLGYHQEIKLLEEQGENNYALGEENKEGEYEEPIDDLMEDPIGASGNNEKNNDESNENQCYMNNEEYSSQAFENGNKQEYENIDINQIEDPEAEGYKNATDNMIPDNQMECAENDVEEQDNNIEEEQNVEGNAEEEQNEVDNIGEEQEAEYNNEDCQENINGEDEENNAEQPDLERENDVQEEDANENEEQQELDNNIQGQESEYALDSQNDNNKAIIELEGCGRQYNAEVADNKDPLFCEEPQPSQPEYIVIPGNIESKVKKTTMKNAPPLIQKQNPNPGPYKFLLGRINPMLRPIVSKVDPDKKIGTLTIAERNEKIRKYNEKKQRRIFSKRIAYVGRKKEADNRFRYKGQFVSRDKAISLIGEAAQNLSSNEVLQEMLNKKSNCSIVLAANHAKIQNIKKLFTLDNNSTENKSINNVEQDDSTKKLNCVVQEGKIEDNVRIFYEMPNVKVPVFSLMKTQSEGFLSSHQNHHIYFPQHKLK